MRRLGIWGKNNPRKNRAVRHNDSCGSVNSKASISYTLTGMPPPGSPLTPPPKPLPVWSDVIPKSKLIFAVGWFNTMAPLHPERCAAGAPCGDSKYGGEPSFCQANWLANLNDNKARRWMNSQGTWVMDRTDATCPSGCGTRSTPRTSIWCRPKS